MTISGAGLVSWTPALAGPQPVTVNVSDGLASAAQDFTIQVAAPFSALLHFSTASNTTTVPGVAAPYNGADVTDGMVWASPVCSAPQPQDFPLQLTSMGLRLSAT